VDAEIPSGPSSNGEDDNGGAEPEDDNGGPEPEDDNGGAEPKDDNGGAEPKDGPPSFNSLDKWLVYHAHDGGRDIMETLCALVRIRRMSALSSGPPDLPTLRNFVEQARSKYVVNNPSLPPPFIMEIDKDLRTAMGKVHRRKVSNDKINLAKIAVALPSKPHRPCYRFVSGHLSSADKIHNRVLSNYLVGPGNPYANTVINVFFLINNIFR
jgi:hypothetical protein